MNMLKQWLAHPLTKGLDIDDPETTALRRQIIQKKSFLNQVYQEWYCMIQNALPPVDGPILELGSGAGFLNKYIPNLITSDIFPCSEVNLVLDGLQLPVENKSLRAIVMINVLHHLSQPQQFLAEASQCVKPGGALIMIEPWVTPWSQLIYTRLHHEPFDTNAMEWGFLQGGPLSTANGALPYIIFARDRIQFEAKYPMWQIQQLYPFMPFRYLVSGGVSLKDLMPGYTFEFWHRIENMLQPWMDKLAMFAQITLIRIN